MDDQVCVRVNTENEQYPVLAIYEVGNAEADYGFWIPRELMRRLDSAYEAVDAAEMAVMRHIAEHYPNARYVRDWVGDRTDG